MSVTIYPEEPCLLPVTFASNPLLVYGKDYRDIEEVLMCLKTIATDPDDKYLAKYLKDGNGGNLDSGDVLINELTNTFTLVKNETDVLPPSGCGFGVYIGVKVSGLQKMLWLRVDKNSKILVETDGIQS